MGLRKHPNKDKEAAEWRMEDEGGPPSDQAAKKVQGAQKSPIDRVVAPSVPGDKSI